jgi:hypothetical protein
LIEGGESFIKVRDEELTAPWARIRISFTILIGAGSDVDIAAEEHDFSAHIDPAVVTRSRVCRPEVIALGRSSKGDKIPFIALNYDSLTIIHLHIGGWKT